MISLKICPIKIYVASTSVFPFPKKISEIINNGIRVIKHKKVIYQSVQPIIVLTIFKKEEKRKKS